MFCFSTMMYLDTSEYQTNSRGVYKKIIAVSPEPPVGHPLSQYTQRVHTTKLSTFNENQQQHCFTALKSQVEHCKLMTEDETPELIILLTQLGLMIDTSVTQMLNANTDYQLEIETRPISEILFALLDERGHPSNPERGRPYPFVKYIFLC